MSDFTAVSNYATLAGFRVIVIANRFACDNSIAQIAHDNLIHQMDLRIAEAHRYIALERVYETASDEWVVDNADAGMYNLQMRALDDKYNDIDLLGQSSIVIDRVEREWCFRGSSEWRSLDDTPPAQEIVGDDVLCGLSAILVTIREETGLVFTTYATATGCVVDRAITPTLNASSD